MEKNMKSKKSEAKFLFKIGICLALLFVVFLSMDTSCISFAKEEAKFCYLSDIPYITDQSSVGWGSITLDRNLDSSVNNGLITLIVDGENKQFFKGISAHATSTLIYDITAYNYDYFTAYIGVDQGRGNNGNGVKFAIYTSTDGENWNLKTPVSPNVMKGNTEAEFVKIDIKDANYLKLYAHNNGNATADHAVYADAKLIKEGYEETEGAKADFIKTTQEYDQIIKNHQGEEITGEYELALLQREFVSKVGYDYLQFMVGYKNSYKETLEWLMNDVENMRYYVLGGTPTGGYANSLKELVRLYEEYKSDFDITDPISEEGIRRLHNRRPDASITKGDLYKRMAITLSLTHSANVGLWMQPSAPESKSDSVVRYQQYKDMYNQGKFKATDIVNITPWFESYNIEEMRYVMNTALDDESMIWLNEYTQAKIDKAPASAWGLLTPHSYISYVWPNYGNPVYYAEENYDYFNELFSVGDKKLYDYGITRGTADHKVYKLWMNFRNKFGTGCVCGGISKSGHCIRGSHAIPSAVIGQPGHAALLYYTQDANGKGYWGIDNDVSGWTLSEKGERLLMGWGNANTNYARGSYQVVYMALAQEALNDYENFEKCEKMVMLANTYAGDLVKQEEIYRKALEIQNINIDAWLGLINVYNANESKTENQYFDLAKEVAENLKYFPLPMQQLTNLIKPHLTSMENQYRFTLLQTRILTEGTKVPNNTDDNYYVYQPSLTRLEANYLLGKLDKTIATFSFDGEDSGKIVLSDRFAGNGVRWDYSLDGKKTWNEKFFTAEEEHKLQLTQEQIASITSENDIYVHIVGVNYDEENLYKIDIQESSGLPATLYANDLENKLIAAVPTMQWKYREEDNWKWYRDEEPDLTGDKTVIVRMGATGVYLAETTSSTFTFTQDNFPQNRQYIPISHLSIHGVSTEATSQQGAATFAIDGNANTRYHSAWNGSDTERYMIVKLDEPVCLSAVEFVPAGGGNGKIYDGTIYGSMDGENWEILSRQTNLSYTNQANTVEQAIANTKAFEVDNPSKVQYVKIVADRTNGNWFAARMFNFYEDKTVKTSVKFSFDGPNAGKIVLEDKFEDANWSYSIDGGTTWKSAHGKEHQLTAQEMNQINESDKIRVRFEGDVAECTVNIKTGTAPTITPYVNDWENRLIGLTDVSTLEWKIIDATRERAISSDEWISFSEEEPIVQGDKTLLVRTKGTGVYTPSTALEYHFTADNQPDTAKYIPIKHLSVHSYSTQSVDSNRPFYAPNAIDGNRNTLWHTDFRYSVLEQEGNPFITIKLDEPKYISALEFVQKKYRTNDPDAIKNAIVFVSMDGENWTEAGRKENCEQNEEFKRIEFGESVQAQYVKLDIETYGIFASTAMINLYEDITKREEVVIPTAEIEYSTTELTNQDVVATLVNESTDITVTNNGGSKTHTFTENGAFVFEFVDSKGTKGSSKAEVSCIDKVAPTARVDYNISELTDESVVATLSNPSEEITITNNEGNNSYTFTENGEFTFEFEDKAGNKGTAKANVYWIMTEEQKYEDLKAEIIEMIEDYQSKATDEEINNKLTNKEEKHRVVEAYNRLKEEDKAPYKAFIDRINAGGKPVVTLLQNVYRVKAGTKMNLYDFITIEDNEDGKITPNSDHVKIVTDLNIDKPGTYEVAYEVMDSDKNVTKATMQVIVAEVIIPTAEIEYSTTEKTSEEVVATLVNPSTEITVTNNGGSREYTFTKNGEFIFEFIDSEGNKGTAIAKVDWIEEEPDEPIEDTTAPTAKVVYDITEKTTKNVVATLTDESEEIIITNNDGSREYTFTKNGEFTFEFEDKAGNKGTAIAKVDWIEEEPDEPIEDTTAPTAKVVYDITEKTAKNVVATLTEESEEIIITNNGGSREYTFTKNGEFTFEFEDKAGNKGTVVAKVDWIEEEPDEPIEDTTAPTAKVVYDITEKTTKNVVATLTDESEEIIITNNDGSRTYTFTKNGEFTFEFEDKAGNKGTAVAKVDWIEEKKPDEPIEDKDTTAPTAKVIYDIKETTNKDVNAMLIDESEPITITNNNGRTVYTFTENGEFIFEFEDKAGNKGTAVAKVDWIDKVAPTASVVYNVTEATTENVIATLTGESEEIIVTNNNGKKNHTFTKNGEFTFEFKDKAGNKGTAIAKVDWIKEEETVVTPPDTNTDNTNNGTSNGTNNGNSSNNVSNNNGTTSDADKITDTMTTTSNQNKNVSNKDKSNTNTNQKDSIFSGVLPFTGKESSIGLWWIGILVVIVLALIIKKSHDGDRS